MPGTSLVCGSPSSFTRQRWNNSPVRRYRPLYQGGKAVDPESCFLNVGSYSLLVSSESLVYLCTHPSEYRSDKPQHLFQGYHPESTPYRAALAYFLVTFALWIVPWTSNVWTNRSWKGGITGVLAGRRVDWSEQVVLITGGERIPCG
jgi:hypothetical protein